jgi:DNA-binding response OmpR family regulator
VVRLHLKPALGSKRLEGLALSRRRPPDVVVLDIGMPHRDGFNVLRELRRHTDVPVVMLTARDDVADKVGALESGADDYVAKPFAFDELVARIRAVLRRGGADTLDRLAFADLVVDLGKGSAFTVRLPLASGGVRDGEPGSEPDPAGAGQPPTRA